MKSLERHPGISMHHIAVGGGVMGALFAIGTTLIFVIGVPPVRWFLLASLLLGVAVGLVLYAYHKRRPVELTDLSAPDAAQQNQQR